MNNSVISTYDFNNKHTDLGLEIIDLQKIVSMREVSGKAHRLNFYQILVVTKGRGVHEVDFQSVAYSENTVIPVAMGQVQRFEYNPELEGYAIVFTPDFLVKENLVITSYSIHYTKLYECLNFCGGNFFFFKFGLQEVIR